uniref:Uncharacterized protein n=1 Tax=Oryza rufipogon TaxID=4529 RepID=A0A0E0RI08_ORYRU
MAMDPNKDDSQPPGHGTIFVRLKMVVIFGRLKMVVDCASWTYGSTCVKRSIYDTILVTTWPDGEAEGRCESREMAPRRFDSSTVVRATSLAVRKKPRMCSSTSSASELADVINGGGASSSSSRASSPNPWVVIGTAYASVGKANRFEFEKKLAVIYNSIELVDKTKSQEKIAKIIIAVRTQ